MAGTPRRLSSGTADLRPPAGHAPGSDSALLTSIGEAVESSAQPSIPQQRDSECGALDEVNPTSTSELWEAIARARAEYDPLILNAAESAIAAAYQPLAHLLASRHDRVGPDTVLLRAAEQGLRKAIGCWPRPDQPWGFEEYARGAIEMEIRVIHDRHGSDRHGRSRPRPA